MKKGKRNWVIMALGVAVVLASSIGFASMPPEHFVSVGGRDIFDDQNLSMMARERNGVVTGQFSDQFTAELGGGGVHADIECLRVRGNQAWIRGVVTHGTVFGEDVTGHYVYSSVRDRGTSANDPPDQVSFTYILPDLIPFCENRSAVPLENKPAGQVIVR